MYINFNFFCFEVLNQFPIFVFFYFRLYCSPDWVWKELPIASKFSLDGVIPVCLKTDYLQDKVSRRYLIDIAEYRRNRLIVSRICQAFLYV